MNRVPYTVAELERLLSDLESESAERKESFKGDAPKKVREAVCAFANDLPGSGKPGVVLIGARDNGRPSGLAVTDELLRALADIKYDGQITPPPTLTVTKEVLSGHDLAVITVWPADAPPVVYQGRIFIRTGPRKGIASAQDERILSEKRRYGDRPFDVRPLPSANLADLDRRRFEDEYLPAAYSSDVLAANERSYEQRLASTKMVAAADEPIPTVLGTLILCPRTRDFLPGAYLQFLRISGRNLADPVIDEQAIEGPIAEMLRRVDDKLAAHNRVAVDITGGERERRTFLYPPAALQQLVRNAVLHRTYDATFAPVRLTFFDDRIEIWSPGGPFGAVTPENFGRPGVSDYRNPSLAEALRVLGFVQRFGVGLAIARRELAAHGHPEPEFEVSSASVGVTLRRAA